MRNFLSIILVSISAAALSAQTTAGRQPVKVLDYGQLYSTYNWETNLAELYANLGDVLASAVVNAGTERAWPAGINSLTARAENRGLMAGYHVYYLTSLDRNVAVLVAPADENRTMPTAMQPAGDIYFAIGLGGVELEKGSGMPSKASIEKAPAGNFNGQMQVIVGDFETGFVNLTGAQTAEDEDGLVVQYESRANLDGATDVYFMEDLLSATTIFHASFPGSTDQVVALRLYKKLVSQVETLQLGKCGLQKQVEIVDGDRHSQLFMAYDPAGKLNIAYQNMVVDIHLEQGETFDAKGLLVSDWYPVLEIYEQ